ncbi:MAG: hypothetical protein KF847_04165 [Pirellulales bacterium]|nr:hypothetical protein [Pirellulales bacterium]
MTDADPLRLPQDLDPLIDRYLDGVASIEDVRLLERLVAEDEAVAARMAERSLVHRQILELVAEEQLHSIMSQYAGGMPGPVRPRTESGGSRFEAGDDVPIDSCDAALAPNRATSRGLLALVPLALAAAALAILAWPARAPDAPLAEHDAPARTSVAATVTQLSDAVWTPGAVRYRHGEQLVDGSVVELDRGLAKITFECGAEVMLQGPCSFTIRDKMVGVLRRGKLAANVPRRAFSFAILSPEVDFVDLGTAFGISVDEDGDAELHVFEGEVLYSPSQRAEADRSKSVHIHENGAVKLDKGGAAVDILLNTEEYSPLMALRRPQRKGADPFDGSGLALWLAADAGVSTDREGRVLAWQDLLLSDNRTAEDATQSEPAARPRLEPQAINGLPAIRFDGAASHLVTTPLETTDDQTVVLACQFSPGAFAPGRQWGGQIINYDGPPSREASNTLSPGILQIGEPLLEADFRPSRINAQVFAGFIGSAVVETGRVDADPLGPERPAIIAYRYDYRRGKADLWINGRRVGESRAFAPQALTSRKIIGRHAWKELFFHGDLAELMIFNDAASDERLAATVAYLSEKYQIPLELHSADKGAEWD